MEYVINHLNEMPVSLKSGDTVEYKQYFINAQIPEGESGIMNAIHLQYALECAERDPNHLLNQKQYQKRMNIMDFGDALHAMKLGQKVAREGWNGKGMFAFIVQGSKFTVNRRPLLGIYPEGTEVEYRPHLDLRAVDGSIGTWSPSNSDILADDWMIVRDQAA